MNRIWRVARGYLAVALLPVAFIVGCDIVNRVLLFLWQTNGRTETHPEQFNFLTQAPLYVVVLIVIAVIFGVRR